jgi:hypothetical protein
VVDWVISEFIGDVAPTAGSYWVSAGGFVEWVSRLGDDQFVSHGEGGLFGLAAEGQPYYLVPRSSGVCLLAGQQHTIWSPRFIQRFVILPM